MKTREKILSLALFFAFFHWTRSSSTLLDFADAGENKTLSLRQMVQEEIDESSDELALEQDHGHAEDDDDVDNDDDDKSTGSPKLLAPSTWKAHVLNALLAVASFGLLRPVVRATLRFISWRLQPSQHTQVRLTFVHGGHSIK